MDLQRNVTYNTWLSRLKENAPFIFSNPKIFKQHTILKHEFLSCVQSIPPNEVRAITTKCPRTQQIDSQVIVVTVGVPGDGSGPTYFIVQDTPDVEGDTRDHDHIQRVSADYWRRLSSLLVSYIRNTTE